MISPFRPIVRNPLSQLFWKIFLWFWLAMMTLVFSLTVVVAFILDPADFLPERRGLFRELEKHGHRLERISEKQSRRSNKRAIRRPNPDLPHEIHLFNSSGKTTRKRPVPNALRHFYQQTRNERQYQVAMGDGLVMVGPYQLHLENLPHQLYLAKPSPDHVLRRLWQILSNHWSVLVTTLLVSGLFCFLLAAYLVSPIRHLQTAARRIAEGDFDTEVSKHVTHRKDEIGQLGKDFNVMSRQLSDLVDAQKRLLLDVSHELRSPLTRLQIALALARKKTVGGQQEYDRIELEIGRLDQLIGQVIQWSRLDNRLNEAMREWVELPNLLSELIEDTDFEAQAQDKQVILIEEEACGLRGNSAILSSAFENIIRNAIRFTPEKTAVRVFLSLREQISEKTAVIIIEDQGPGVPEESIAFLFNPFFRVDETRGEKNSGTGLGMAIAQRAVELHQGTIHVENRHPGLRVIIELPVSPKINE
ncbi:MAG: HAMP domain-containing protein [SAR324 cluster bacterium]|nr:HAMP domain-containing protein [SAR324 cluster bacterium]